MQQKQVSLNNKKLFYTVHGEGPLVVLLHGFGEDSSVWKNQLEALKGFQLLIPDLPGTGQSEIIDDMSMEGMAEVIKEMVEMELQSGPHPSLPPTGEGTPTTQPIPNGKTSMSKDISKSWVSAADGLPTGMGQVCMIGHSMGGYITLAFAEKYGQMLNGLGLFHSSAYSDTEEKKEIRKKGIAFIRKNGSKEFLKTAIPNLYSPLIKEKTPGLIEEQISASDNFSAASLVLYYEAMMQRPNRVNILKNVNIQVLFILGKYDTAVPLKDGLEQCYLPSLSYIHILEDSGHMGMIEERDRSNVILNHFLTTSGVFLSS